MAVIAKSIGSRDFASKRDMRMTSSKAKKEKGRPSEAGHEAMQLIVTLSATKGDVVKVETLSASGQRHGISEKEFAELAGEDEIKDLELALEEAYTAGVRDAIEESDEEASGAGEEDDFERIVLREAAARQLLRRGVRRLILRRALQRSTAPRRAPSHHNGAHGAHKH